MEKKIVLGLLIAIAPFLLVGCGNKKSKEEKEKELNTKVVTCTASDSNGDTSIRLEYDSSKKEITSGNMRFSMSLAAYSAEEKEVIKKTNLCESFTTQEMFKSCNTEPADDKLNIDLTFNLDELRKYLQEEGKEIEVEKLIEDLENSMSVDCTVK